MGQTDDQPDQHLDPDLESEEVELEVDVDSGLSPELLKKIVQDEGKNARFGRVLGAIAILAGVVLMAFGISESVDVTFQSGKTSGHIATGSLGFLLVLVGAGILYATRYRVKIKQSKAD